MKTERLDNYQPIDAKNLADFIQDYESIFRFSKNRLVHPETLLQHVGEVAIICLFIVDWLNEEWEECSPWDSTEHQDLFSESSIATILRRALVHDLEEIITGDIARPTKYSSEDLSSMIKKLELSAADAVVNTYKLPDWTGSWAEAKAGPEGLIVKVADAMTVLLTCYREIILYSNNHFKSVRENASDYVNNMINSLYRKLKLLDESDYENQFITKALIDFLKSGKKLLWEN